MPLDQAEAIRLLNATLDKGTYSPPATSGMMLRLMSAMGTATAAGTEVANAGGSAYAPINIKPLMSAATTTSSASNSSAITFTNMPATTTVGVELWDAASTPRRQNYGQLPSPKTTSQGDSLSFSTNSLTFTLT